MKSPLRIFLILSGLALLLFGAWGALTKARVVITPPTPEPYALDALSEEQQQGYTSLLPEELPDQPLMAPTLHDRRTNRAEPTPTPRPTGAPPLPEPSSIQIDAIGLDAPVVRAASKRFKVKDKYYVQWIVPDEFAAGWSTDSGRPGENTNIVLFGHHNVHGSVFAKLIDLKEGDQVLLRAGETTTVYEVQEIVKLVERGVPLETMIRNASWILPTPEERLTLVTCWPPYDASHRLVVVALPIKTLANEP